MRPPTTHGQMGVAPPPAGGDSPRVRPSGVGRSAVSIEPLMTESSAVSAARDGRVPPRPHTLGERMDATRSAPPENPAGPHPAAADASLVDGNGNTPHPNGNGHATNGIAPHPAPVDHADGAHETGRRAAEPAPSRGLGAHSATAYASAPEAERYRRI